MQSEWLWGATPKGTGWLLVAGLVLRLLGRASAGFHHAWAVMVALAVPAIFVLELSPMPAEWGWRPFAKAEVVVETPGVARVNLSGEAAPLDDGNAAEGGAPIKTPGWVGRLNPAAVSVALWWLGMGGAAIRLGARIRRRIELGCELEVPQGLLRLCHQESVRLGLRRLPALRLAENRMPMTYGLFRPVIVLPMDAADWTDQRRLAVLRHELMHVKRRDLWWTVVVEAVLIPLWWHPLARQLKQQVADLCEQACDDAVILAGSEATDYAADLLDLSRRFGGVPSLCLALPAVSRTVRVTRFQRLLDGTASRRPVSAVRVALAGMAVACLILPGTLLVSCSTARETEKNGAAASSPVGAPPVIAGVPVDAEKMEIAVTFFEVDREALDDPQLADWIAGRRLLLSPGEGFRLFHPQQRGVDVMSVPKVMCKPGQRATVEITREFIYPTAYETDATSGEEVPAGFDTVPVGVKIAVKARATRDPGVIALDVEPSVTEFLRFVEDEAGHSTPEFRTLSRPFDGAFQNGSYLCVGEKSDEVVVEDAVPLLSGIPLLGKLFRTSETLTVRRVIAMKMVVVEHK